MASKAERLIPVLLCLSCMFTNTPALAGIALTPKVYLADLHAATWHYSGSNTLCELRHEIPGFGIGRFVRLAGEDLRFRIDSFQAVPVEADASLHEVSPPWNHAQPDPWVRRIGIAPGRIPVRLSRKPATRLLASLARGQIGSIDFTDWDDARVPVSVQLSPVNYQQPYQAFRRCLQQISAKGYADHRRIRLYYPLNGAALDGSARRQLDGLAEFVLADDSITRIQIKGHTDAKGTRSYNQELSRRRARAVYDYLRQAGVRGELMHVEALGESRPSRRGSGAGAMAANRRVDITLVR